ncbi:preprotein translocase subunit Sec61beta [Candidatus Pacearchaeota archaeon]|nr:preprotein translocase subunit Sec61beta [Candidatus Pacearchaeota archaeon]
MAQQQGISMPSSFGGLMRYNEEYESPFKFSPESIILFVIVIVVFVSVLKIFWPLAAV